MQASPRMLKILWVTHPNSLLTLTTTPLPQDKIPRSMLKLKGSILEEEVDDSPWEESSVEGGEVINEELEDSNNDEEAKGVPQEGANDSVLLDPEGNTLRGHLMLNWKISC